MPKPTIESVVAALNDPVRSGSYNMRVLRVLLKAERDDEWLTPREIAVRAGIPPEAVGSRVRDLRTEGFIINRLRDGGSWRYRSFFYASASDQ